MESRFKDYRKINQDYSEKCNKKIADLPISKALQQIAKTGLLVSIDFISLYPSAIAHKDSKWPKIETTVAN